MKNLNIYNITTSGNGIGNDTDMGRDCIFERIGKDFDGI